MKKYAMIFMLLGIAVAALAQGTDVSGDAEPEFIDGFFSFSGLATVIVPMIVGFIASKLKKPMNKWVVMWVTAIVAVAVTFFSWWMELGFPPSETSVYVVSIDALFVALASTGLISVITSEWLAKLFGKKIEKK